MSLLCSDLQNLENYKKGLKITKVTNISVVFVGNGQNRRRSGGEIFVLIGSDFRVISEKRNYKLSRLLVRSVVLFAGFGCNVGQNCHYVFKNIMAKNTISGWRNLPSMAKNTICVITYGGQMGWNRWRGVVKSVGISIMFLKI
jgi:hypothetical protein